MAVRCYCFGMKTPLIVFLLLLAHYAVSINSHTARLTTFGTTAKSPPNNTHTQPTTPEVELIPVQEVPNVRSAQLTTFGNSNPNDKKNSTGRKDPVRGKLCSDTSECFGLRNTTCTKDPKDGRMKCLCFDHSVPVNAKCRSPPKAPHAECTKDEECTKGATCTAGNSTVLSSKKTCQCLPEYHEDEDECSGGMQFAIPWVILVTCHVLQQFM